jgi:CO dehydrogenase nickel-insertion accessory protein CooC1
MTTTEWFDRGVEEGADYMIVVCDTFDYEDYPVYATAAEFKEKYESHNGMQRIMEVYDLHRDKAEQLRERRAMNLPKGFGR